MDSPGTVIAGKYQLLEVAGSGGMATVWRAVQRTLGFERLVAIKRIREDLMNEDKFVEMFLEEARVSAVLMHPNIVQVFDFGGDDGRYFLVMEWVEGLSLARYLQLMHELGTLPPWHFVAAVGIEALRGLEAAHSRIDMNGNESPIYHRDVTPQNILLGTNGVVKLTDFGLARAMDRARMTAPDMIKGKVGYLAPELTQAKQPTIQSDLYALGVVMWQALAGRKLFSGKDHIDIFVAASKGNIPPLDELRPDVPPQFTDLIDRALARDPGDRFRTAGQWSRLIATLLRGFPERPDAQYIGETVQEVLGYLKRGSKPPSGPGDPKIVPGARRGPPMSAPPPPQVDMAPPPPNQASVGLPPPPPPPPPPGAQATPPPPPPPPPPMGGRLTPPPPPPPPPMGAQATSPPPSVSALPPPPPGTPSRAGSRLPPPPPASLRSALPPPPPPKSKG